MDACTDLLLHSAVCPHSRRCNMEETDQQIYGARLHRLASPMASAFLVGPRQQISGSDAAHQTPSETIRALHC